MKLATLACLAALCLIGPPAHAAPGETANPSQPANAAPSAETPQPSPTSAAQAAPRQASSGRAERRRRSYAACNRASHQRSLRGGKRRRFLIRCRLGYERTHGQPAQQNGGQAVQPGRKP